jgi:hypothetical protein
LLIYFIYEIIKKAIKLAIPLETESFSINCQVFINFIDEDKLKDSINKYNND